jgi:hypothetical protein
MRIDDAREYVVPNLLIPRTLGILNIVFASLVLCCGLFSVASIAFMPAFQKAMQSQVKQVEVKVGQRRQAALDALQDEEKSAKTEAERTAIAVRRASVMSSPKQTLVGSTMDMEAMGLTDPKLLGYWYADIFSGIVLNLVMLISGIGLIRLRPWGRSIWLWTAGVKIVRLLLLYGYFALAVVPIMSEKLGRAIGTMMAQQQQAFGRGGGPSVDMLVRIYAITYTIYAVGIIVVGSIYPAISLWLLNKTNVKAAFLMGPERKPERYSEPDLS